MHQSSTIKIKEIPWRDPLSVFERWGESKWAILFDSALPDPQYGRYSYIAVDPFQVLWAKDGQISIDNIPIPSQTNPFLLLKQLLIKMPQPSLPDIPPFQGGVAGAFSYDLYQYIENIPAHSVDNIGFPDMALGFYDVVISFDKIQKRAWIVSTGWPEKTIETREKRAVERLDFFEKTLKNTSQTERKEGGKNEFSTVDDSSIISTGSVKKPAVVLSNFKSEEYGQAVRQVIDYILAGDIFEANISQCFTTRMPKGLLPFDIYKRLHADNPAPFSAFVNLGDIQVVSASPERFVRLEKGRVESRPIKGTRPRSADQIRDRQLAEELLGSEKDKAENVMIVDLLRNDLSRVCRDHSVKVTQLCGLESYATVHHLVSVITGELADKKDAVDLLLATFPGGSITGAPKIRAMEIIAEIEPGRRGIYCGSLGYIGFNGAMDTSIAIRTCTIKGKEVTFQAGGAVVVDSNPDSEYEETLVKSSALCHALREEI